MLAAAVVVVLKTTMNTMTIDLLSWSVIGSHGAELRNHANWSTERGQLLIGRITPSSATFYTRSKITLHVPCAPILGFAFVADAAFWLLSASPYQILILLLLFPGPKFLDLAH